MDEPVYPEMSLFLAMLEESASGMVLLDGGERVVFWNRWMEKFSDRKREEVLTRSLTAVFPELTGSRVVTAVKDALEMGLSAFLSHKLTPSPFPLRSPGRGVDHWVRMCQTVLIKPVQAEGGLRHCMIQIQDITHSVVRDRQLREQAKQLESARQRAEAANQAKSAFLANMSHEVRTPLNAILGMSEMLSEADTDAEVRHLTSVIQRSGDELLRVIDDILDFSKIEAGEIYLEKGDFSIEELLDDLAAQFDPLAGKKGLRMSCRKGHTLPAKVVGDRGRMRQVLSYLLANAVKFTRKGGISLSADVVGGERGAVRIRFQVADTGIGISPEQLEAIFESFTQGDGSITRHHGGTGLGLTITRGLVEMMKGRVHVESSLEGGTVFYVDIVFPLAEGVLAAPADGGSEGASAGVRVLLVEDDEINQDVLLSMLKVLTPVPRVAANGREALKILELEEFDMVLMDCQMPIMDGFTACRALRKRESGGDRRLPVVALTAHAMKGDRERCLAAGMDDYLTKPIRKKVLLEAISRWTGWRRG